MLSKLLDSPNEKNLVGYEVRFVTKKNQYRVRGREDEQVASSSPGGNV